MKALFTLLLYALLASQIVNAQADPELFYTYKQGSLDAPEFTTNNFKCIAVGKNNIIWAGTQYGGLYLFDDKYKVWRKSDKLTNVFINDIKADGDSGIWIAQSGTQSFNTNNTNIAGGVNYFRLAGDANSNMEFYSVTGTISNADILSRNVRSLYLDKSRKEELGQLPRVWVAQGTSISSFKTKRGGLSIGLNDRFKPPYPSTLFTNVEDSFEVHRDATPICEAIGGDSKEVWVAVRQNFNKSQILRFDNTGKCVEVFSSGDTLLPAGFSAQAIYFDAVGNRWIGLKNGGLVIKTPKGWVKMDWENLIPPGTQINYNAISADESGNVYIGTSNGLLEYLDPVFNPASKPDNPNSYRRYTTADGLPSNNITGIAYDKKNGKLLITSSGGVTFMNRREPFIRGVVFDVYTSIDSVNDYAGLQRKPLSNEVRVRLLKDGVEEEVVTPDANGIFELKKAEDDEKYTVEVTFQREGRTMKYVYNDIRNHTKMQPVLMPDSLIGEIKAFRDKMDRRCFTLKLPFLVEINNLTCVDGFYLDDYEQAFQPFYDIAGIDADHKKKVDNLANYYAALATVYQLGGYATELNSEMITNAMDAAESLTAFVETAAPLKDRLTADEFIKEANGLTRVEIAEQEKALMVSGLKLLKEGFASSMNLVSSSLSSYPRAKTVFDKSITVITDASDLAIDYLEKDRYADEKYGAARKAIFDNGKKLIATGGASLFYKYMYARDWQKNFVFKASNASKNGTSGFTYNEVFDNLYNPSANSLAKYAKDTLSSKKSSIETLVKTAKVAEAAGGVLDAASALAIIPGGQAIGAIAKGLATAAKAVKTFSLGLAMGQGGIGCYQVGVLADDILPKSQLLRGPRVRQREQQPLQEAPAILLARKNSYNQKLAELQTVYNTNDTGGYRAKYLEFAKEDSSYTAEMTKTLNALWSSTDSAIILIPGFKGKIEKVIDSFVSRQYTLRLALHYQNIAYRFDPDKTPYLEELNNLSNEIKVLNDSAINGITYLIDDINNFGIGAPAFLVQDDHKVVHNNEPGTAGTVTYTFTNYGSDPQQNVRFKISQPSNGFVITTADSVNVGTIQAHESKQISFSFNSPTTSDSVTVGYYDIEVNADNGSFKDVSGVLYVINTNATLPVSLSRFNVSCAGTGTKLTWQTSSEENSSHFEIERSNNGAQWRTVSTVKAAGNSNSVKNYQYVDVKGGNALFRLKQVDKDGKATYSSVEQSDCQAKQGAVFVYPIPAKNVLNIVVRSDKSSKASIMLVDVLGRVTRRLNTDLTKGTNNYTLNIAGLSAGQYYLRVAGAEIIHTQKVTISQ